MTTTGGDSVTGGVPAQLPVGVEEQAIACLKCGAADIVREDEERAVKWPAWEPGPHFGFCPQCGGDCWAAEPRTVETA